MYLLKKLIKKVALNASVAKKYKYLISKKYMQMEQTKT